MSATAHADSICGPELRGRIVSGMTLQSVTIDLGSLWAAAGVLLGLQLAAFTLRVSREIAVGGTGDSTWLPLADGVNVVSLVVTSFGVFVAPVLHLGGSGLPTMAFGLGVLLLAGYPFALAGHYDMFNPNTHARRRAIPPIWSTARARSRRRSRLSPG
jgi:hypothetical protein